MFTGIVTALGTVRAITPQGDSADMRLTIAAPWPDVAMIPLGASIGCSGCCLTAVEVGADWFTADASAETLSKTTLGRWQAGTRVNLERSLRLGDELGGHLVSGHVDGIGRVTRLVPEGDNWWLSVRVPEDQRRYVAEKGSIAIDGISLTVARWHEGVADIAVIPFTHAHTNVRAVNPHDAVNIETDILAKYVESLLANHKASPDSHLTISHLIEEGF